MNASEILCQSFLESHPTEAALALEGVSKKPLARFFARLAPEAAARVLEHLDPELAADCMELMTPRAAATIAGALSPHPRVVALRLVGERRREQILGALEDLIAEQTRRMLRFADKSVAALMETDVLSLPEEMTIGEAMRRVRRSRLHFEGELYVLDKKRGLVGVTTLQALLKAPPDQPVSEVMSTECAKVLAGTSQRELVNHPLWVEHNSVAVVDDDNVLMGVIDHRAVAREGVRMETGNDDGLEAALALGELYWVGLTGMLDGLAGRGLVRTGTGEK